MTIRRPGVHLDPQNTSYGDTALLKNSVSVMAAPAPKPRSTRPTFAELPLQSHHPKGSAWGLWGAGDERGTLNLLNEETTRNASLEVSHGRAVSLK